MSNQPMSSGKTSGARSPLPLIATWNPARDAWETGEVSLICGHSDVSSETWVTSGTTRNGVAYERPTWEPATSDSGYSSSLGDEMCFFHTPDTMPDAPNSGSNTRSKPPGLGNQVAALGVEMPLLMTPVASEGEKPSNTMGVERRKRTGQVFLTNQIVTLCGLDPTEG